MSTFTARHYAGEAFGTFVICLLGCSGVAVAILYGQVSDLVAMGAIWGGAVATAVWLTATFSGAHLNPAVTLAFAIGGKHPWIEVPKFWAAQIAGAFAGAGVVLLWFGGAINAWIAEQGITKAAAGGERAAMILAPYSPNPAIIGVGDAAYTAVPIWRGFLVELIGAAILIAFVLIVTHRRTTNSPPGWAFPLSIGALILMLTVGTGALTMTSLNPARDLGPRLMLLLDGYGATAFPGPRGGLSLLVTVGAPLVAGLLMGLLSKLWLNRTLDTSPDPSGAEVEAPSSRTEFA
ncbi:MIP/aquaporin family protein [Oerskovia turbata]